MFSYDVFWLEFFNLLYISMWLLVCIWILSRLVISYCYLIITLIWIVFLCVYAGQSGLGKSTLMNTLFKSKVSRKSVMGTAEERIPKTIEIKSISHGKQQHSFAYNSHNAYITYTC